MTTKIIRRRGPNQHLRGCRKPKLTPAEKAESQRLRLACVIAGITRTQLAAVVHVSPQTCGKWLAEQCDFRPDYLALITANWPNL